MIAPLASGGSPLPCCQRTFVGLRVDPSSGVYLTSCSAERYGFSPQRHYSELLTRWMERLRILAA